MPFDLRYDPAARLVRVRLSGFWTGEDFSEFVEAIRATIARARTGADMGGRVVLDLSGFPVQASDVVERLVALINEIEQRVGRFAIVSSGSALQRMQVERMFPATRTKIFASGADALCWLGAAPALAD